MTLATHRTKPDGIKAHGPTQADGDKSQVKD